MNRWHSLPAELYALVEHTPATVLLESARPVAAELHSVSASRLFTAPLRIFIANESADLPGLFAEIESAVALGHYAVGFFTYECGRFFEPIANVRPSRPGQPLAWFGIYEQCYLFDHDVGTFPGGDPPGLEKTRPANVDLQPQLEAALAITEPQYAERISTIHEWIRSGDVYQLNFTDRKSVVCRSRWSPYH